MSRKDCEHEMKNKDIRILFFAKYAPKSIESKLPVNIEDEVYAVYHYGIYASLYKEFEHIISTNRLQDIVETKPDVDYIFSLYNRMPFRNSEVFVSSLAEYYKIPYLGATPNVRAIAEDKQLAKITATCLGIDTPKWAVCNVGNSIPKIDFKGPYFVKPRFGASSKNIDSTSVCKDLCAIVPKIHEYHAAGIDVIIEEYIEGTSITVPILNNFGCTKILPFIIEESSEPYNIITYKQKRKIQSGLNRTINQDTNLQEQVNEVAKLFFDSVQPLDYTRIDFIIDKSTHKPYFIEFNVCCNLGKHAAINIAATSIGIEYDDLINNIIYSSLFRQNLINDTFGKKF